jgi:hypothetical protein
MEGRQRHGRRSFEVDLPDALERASQVLFPDADAHSEWQSAGQHRRDHGRQDAGAKHPATTTQETVQQSMAVFTAIYKRVYRSLAQEFKKIYA